MVDSKYNTDPNYDYGEFSLLETKLHSAKLAINSFVVSFENAGVYTFADWAAPNTMTTLVLVTADKESGGLVHEGIDWQRVGRSTSAAVCSDDFPVRVGCW